MAAEQLPPKAASSAPRILVVEDNANDAELLHAHLAESVREGAEVLYARSLAEGLRLLESHDIQLTLLDLDLPDSTGFHTLERMRAATAGPVIVISGNGHPSLVEEVLKRRAYDVIPKHELDGATLRRILRLARLHYESGQTLRATEGRFRALLENSAEALVLFNAAGRVEYASASLRRVLGYESAETLGRHGLGFVHPEDRDIVRASFLRLNAAAGASETLRLRFLHKDGSVRLLEASLVNRLADADVAGIVCNFRDVTDADGSRQALAEAEVRNRNLTESSPDAILVHAFGEVLYLNPACLQLLGFASAQEIVGRPMQDILDPRDHEQVRTRMAQLAAGVHQPFAELRLKRKDGTTVYIDAAATPIQYDGRAAVQVVARDATERRQRERALRDSESRFRSLTELASDWFWEQDAELRFKSFAGGQGDLKWGGDQSLSVGLRRWEIPGLVPLSASWEEHRALLEARQPFRNFEYLRVLENGARRYVTSSGEPVFGTDGSFQGYRGTAADITERKTAEQRVRLEHQVARHLADAASASEGLVAAMRAICESEGWDCGRYFSADETTDELRITECWGVADEQAQRFVEASRGLTQRAGEGLAGAVWRSGETLWLHDVSHDPRVSEAGRAINASMRSAFMFPVTVESRTIGVLSITGRVIREPDQPLLQTMRTIGSQIGQFLQRKLAEQSMRQSEERFRSLTGLSSDWYWEQDAELRFIATGGADKARGGISAAQHTGLRRWELPGTEALSGSWDEHQAVLAARLPFRDLMLRRTAADGALHYVSVSGEPIFGAGGEFRGYRGVAKDVTAGHRTMIALRENEERFRNLSGLSSDWYWEQDAEFRFTRTSVDQGSLARGDPMRPLGKARWELPLTPLSGSWEQHREDLQARRSFRDFEYSYGVEGGGTRYVSASGYPAYDEAGKFLGYRGIAKDVTARQNAKEALRASHERFEIVARATNDVVRDWNLETDQIWWNENLTAVFGHARETGGSRLESWTGNVHPEDVGHVVGSAKRAIERGERAWQAEYRFRNADGEYVDVFDRGLVIHDAAGKAVRMIGAMQDVSERKHAEGRVRMHAQRQEAIARFGQFALGRHSVEELYTEAARALRCDGVDAVCLQEMFTERHEYLVRATQGEGPHASLGKRGPIAPDSVWPEILRDNAPRLASREYLASRPLDRPWRAWLHAMGSAVYAPVRDDEKPIAMLCIYAVREHAFGPEDVRFAEAVGHVLSTALQRQKAEERLAHLAQFDALTGLPNRTLLQDRLSQAVVQSRRRQDHAGVLFVDLDRFKLINDTLGHHQGDALIRQVGQRLLACVRAGDTVGRISGDEFAVVLAGMAHPDDAALVAQKVLESLAQPFDLGGNEAYVTASIGIAAYPGDGDAAETLLKNADMAMYRAKESSRNSFCFFTAEMNQRSLAKVQLNADLRRALERGEFALHYQPKVDLASGKLRGLEALLRWNRPARGLVSPGEFIPALEDSGLIIPVGEWVVEEACRQLQRWTAAGCTPVPVAVNLSPKQFRRRDLDVVIAEALVRAGVSAEYLELEITESCLMENPEDAVRVMQNLRAAGLRISIDDFGTGYSSLSYLTRLPLSALKIDRSFVRDAHTSVEAASIVRAIIDMAQNLRLTVIAEGVETEEQAAFLRRHGCDQAQGYYFGRPVAAEHINQRLG